MKVLITGSSGLLGRILVKSLIAREIHVTGLDIKEPEDKYGGDFFRFCRCSITDRDDLSGLFVREKPTHVIHLACSLNKFRNLKKEYDNDVVGSENILEFVNNTDSVKQLIFMSSATAYGGGHDKQMWLNEKQPLNPGKYSYGLNKKYVEEIYTNATVREDLNITLVRICWVVGPGCVRHAGGVSVLLNWSWLPSFYRENKIQFLHAEDFAALIYLIICDDRIKGVFNVAPDSYSVVREILPDKKFIWMPVLAAKGLLLVLWTLRILNLHPSSLDNSIYPVLLDPTKIISWFNYKFKYSSTAAFMDTKKENNLK